MLSHVPPLQLLEKTPYWAALSSPDADWPLR
jgi:hypothetical protein